MTLNGIDISNWQSGIDIKSVPADFIIVKATQGTGYVSPTFAAQASATVEAGKMLGLYHYISGGGASGEAANFAKAAASYIGRALLAIDWESAQNKAWGDAAYLDAVVAQVVAKTGVTPLIYVSKAYLSQVSDIASRHGCGLWVAQYANNSVTGYQPTPWNEGSYQCAIRQYSSSGRLNGYAGSLDLDKFYGDADAWARYAGKASGTAPAPAAAAPAPTAPQIAVDGIIGPATVRKWQQVMGTTVDGVVSNQVDVSYRPVLRAVNHNKPYGASLLVKAVQRTLGVTVDGLLGPDTIKAMQRHLGVTADGILGPATARALQTRLNGNRF